MSQPQPTINSNQFGGRPKVAIVGGPDVDLRLDLMRRLSPDFDLFAVGPTSALAERFSDAGFRYFNCPMARGVNPASDLIAAARMTRLFRRERPTIVHAFDTKPCALARLSAKIAAVPVIVGTMPGPGILYTEAVTGQAKRRFIRLLYEPVQRLASNLSDATIFYNREDASASVARRTLPAGKMRLIPGSGINTEEISRASVATDEARRVRIELDLPPDCVVVTMVSRLVRTKGILEFARAARELVATNSNIRFLLAGPWDRESPNALSSAEVRALAGPVTWLGERRDIAAIYAASDICALPSYAEGLPRALMEAASMNLPLVATDVPGCREVVDAGVNGLLVPPRDSAALTGAIRQLAESPELRRRFGEASRQIAVDRFDSRSIAKQVAQLYSDLIASKGPSVAVAKT